MPYDGRCGMTVIPNFILKLNNNCCVNAILLMSMYIYSGLLSKSFIAFSLTKLVTTFPAPLM